MIDLQPAVKILPDGECSHTFSAMRVVDNESISDFSMYISFSGNAYKRYTPEIDNRSYKTEKDVTTNVHLLDKNEAL